MTIITVNINNFYIIKAKSLSASNTTQDFVYYCQAVDYVQDNIKTWL